MGHLNFLSDLVAIMERMAPIKHKILVLSGKGGVGKSTFSAQLSFALADMDYQVGLPDIDICGPSIPKLLGLEWQDIHQSNLGWSPIYLEGSDFVHRLRCMKPCTGTRVPWPNEPWRTPHVHLHGCTTNDALRCTLPVPEPSVQEDFSYLKSNLGVIFIGFMLPHPDEACHMEASLQEGTYKTVLEGCALGRAGLSCGGRSSWDIRRAYFNRTVSTGIDGVIIVTTPQQVSLVDVRKEI